MSDFDSRLIEQLTEGIARDEVVLFVGYGLSVAAGFPSWSELMRSWPVESGVGWNGVESLREFLLRLVLLRGRHAVVTWLRDELHYDESTRIAPTANYRRLASLGIRTWLTTNWDNLIEQTLYEAQQPFNIVIRDLDFTFTSSSRRNIVKLLGDLEQPDSLILTEDDLLHHLYRWSGLPAAVTTLMLQNSILFIGCDPGDLALQLLYQNTSQFLDGNLSYLRTSYMVLPHVDPFVERRLAQHNIRAIDLEAVDPLQASEHLAEFLEMVIAQMRPLQVFLSYAREDMGEVINLYEWVRSEGFKPWMDVRDLLPGQQWQDAIPRAIRQSAIVLVCLSQSSVSKRGYLQREIKTALDIWEEKLDEDIYVIPVRLDDCIVPEKLSRFQWMDWRSDSDRTKLLAAMSLQKTRIGRASLGNGPAELSVLPPRSCTE